MYAYRDTRDRHIQYTVHKAHTRGSGCTRGASHTHATLASARGGAGARGVRESWRKSHSVANCEQTTYRLVHCILNAHMRGVRGTVSLARKRVRVCMSKRGQLAPTA